MLLLGNIINYKEYFHMPNVNYVIKGEYKDKKIVDRSILQICHAQINGTDKPLSKFTISSYTVIDESNKEEYSFLKGALGAAFFGGLGAVAGIGGKSRKEYLIAIEWKNGGKSLILIDGEYYKTFVKTMF